MQAGIIGGIHLLIVSGVALVMGKPRVVAALRSNESA